MRDNAKVQDPEKAKAAEAWVRGQLKAVTSSYRSTADDTADDVNTALRVMTGRLPVPVDDDGQDAA